MKKAIFITTLIFVYCSVISSQIYENNQSKQEPKLIAEFDDRDNEWNKLSVSLLVLELAKKPSTVGLISVRNDKKFSQRLKSLEKALLFMKADLSRINILVVDEQEKDINVLAIENCAEMPKCENCIVIRAIDIDKIEKLFSPKTNRKR